MKDNTANIISIGQTDIEWIVAKGRYDCTYAIIESLNPFDRVICGILYRKGGLMPKSEIARLMGFNSIDDPTHNLYVDKSEWAIFCNAVRDLVHYRLVEEVGDCLSLTSNGKVAFESKHKRNLKEREITLWDDEFGCGESVKGLLTFQCNYDSENPRAKALLNAPMESLGKTSNSFIDKEQSDLISITEKDRVNYTIRVPFYVYFNVSSSTLLIEMCCTSESEDINNLNSVINGNDQIKTKVLESLFKEQIISIINKPSHQIDLENCCNYPLEITGNHSLFGIKEIFDFILSSEGYMEIFFFIDTLNTQDVTILLNLANSMPYRIICVEYRYSNDNTAVSSNNICFRQSNKRRSKDFCILGDGSYFSETDIVVPFNGNEYTITAFRFNTDHKYKVDRIRDPFGEQFVDQLIDYTALVAERIEKHPSAGSIRSLIQLFECIKRYGENSKTHAVSCSVSQIKNSWKDDLIQRAEEFRISINAANASFLRVKLTSLINESSGICENELSEIFESIKLLIDKNATKASKVKEYAYILDASVLMNMPDILNRFNRTHERVYIPRAMEQEIDGLAHDKEKGSQAKLVQRFIRRYRTDYPQVLKIYDNVDRSLLPIGYITPGVKYQKDNDMFALMIELSNKESFEKIIIVTRDQEFTDNVKDYIRVNDKSEVMGVVSLSEFILSRETDDEATPVTQAENRQVDIISYTKDFSKILSDSNADLQDNIPTNALILSIDGGMVTIEMFDGKIFTCPLAKFVSQKAMGINQKVYACISHSGKTALCVICEMSYGDLLNIFSRNIANIYNTDNYCIIRNIFRCLKKILTGQSRRDLKTLRKEISAVYKKGHADIKDDDDDEEE